MASLSKLSRVGEAKLSGCSGCASSVAIESQGRQRRVMECEG
ncbi:hypothetical protein A2U01_0080738, partial [Trifolium medium]|nr:hypothetical protein [Trifolium medium]